MARRNASLMSDALKWELAKELGVQDTVATEGWGGVPSRQCGCWFEWQLSGQNGALLMKRPIHHNKRPHTGRGYPRPFSF